MQLVRTSRRASRLPSSLDPFRLNSTSTRSPTLPAWTAPTRSSRVVDRLVAELGDRRRPAAGRPCSAGLPGGDRADQRRRRPRPASTLTPRDGWLTFSPRWSCSATSLALLLGMAKPTPMLPLLLPGGGDGGVDADHLALGVDQRAAGVARVDRGVGLQQAGDRADAAWLRVLLLLAAGLDGAVLGADDARGDRALQAERAADGEHRVADLHRVAVAERGRRSGR